MSEKTFFINLKKWLAIGATVGLLAGCSTSSPVTSTEPVSTPPPATSNPTSPSGTTTPAQEPPAPQPSAQNPPNPVSIIMSYQNSPYHFQFSYPQAFKVVTPNYANLKEALIEVQLPSTAYPKTNFGDAGFAVSTQPAKNLTECLSLNSPEGSSGFKDTTIIHDTDFHKTSGSGAGAGNFYESRTYRTFRNRQCFEINEVVHTLNIGNFEPGSVNEISKDELWKQLEGILATFQFTQ